LPSRSCLPQFAVDPDRTSRFKCETQLLASLNHSNIAAVHGFEESNGVQALALELVHGPTLADRIAQGAMPIKDALAVARQIADALGAARASYGSGFERIQADVVVGQPLQRSAGAVLAGWTVVAYTSNESSAIAVYVQPFSPAGSAGTGGAKWLISKGLGAYPRWSSDGKQLFYINGQSLDLMAVDIDTSKGFQAGTPRRLFTAPPPMIPVGWDNMPDDKRFVFVTAPNAGRPAPFTVVVNWAASLKK
jgi:hypothetical protein